MKDPVGSIAIEDPLAAALSVIESTAIELGPDGYTQFLTELRSKLSQQGTPPQ